LAYLKPPYAAGTLLFSFFIFEAFPPLISVFLVVFDLSEPHPVLDWTGLERERKGHFFNNVEMGGEEGTLDSISSTATIDGCAHPSCESIGRETMP
jgi:hypothetical protein